MLNNLTSLLESLLNEESLEDFYKKQKSRFPKLIKQIEYLEQNQVPIKYFNFIKKQLSSTQDSIENIVNQALSSDKSKLKVDKPEENYFSIQKKKYPHLSKQINYLEQNKVPNKYIDWIIKQINVESPEPIEDIVPLVQAFEKNQGQLEKKNINQYENTGELHHALEDLNVNKEQELQSRTISSSDIQDVLAEKDGWYVTFPHTTQASCDLGKSTTWCTARTQSGNMFLNYVAAKQDTILFYVVNPNLNVFKEPFAKMSIGYVQGEPKFDMGDNSLTVNADNKDITEKKFIEVVGSENASLFLNTMSRKVEELEGIHPAQKEMEAISQDYDLFLKKIATYKNTPQNYEAKKEFLELLKKEYKDDTNLTIKNYIDNFFREIAKTRSLAVNTNTPSDDLTILSKHLDSDVRMFVAKNSNTKPEDLMVLSTDPDYYVRDFLLLNKSTPLQAKINVYSAFEEDDYKIGEITKNPNTHPLILRIFTQNKNTNIKLNLANNPNTPSDVLSFIAYDEDDRVRRTVAQHPNTSQDDLSELANDHDEYVLSFVAKNPNTSQDDLSELANHKNLEFVFVREEVARNPNTSPDVLEMLASYPWGDVSYFAKKNPNFPKNIKESSTALNSKRFKQLVGI